MFDQLIESRPTRVRTTGEMLASIVVHGALITGAAVATNSVAEPGRVWNPDTTAFVLDRLPPTPATPQRQPVVETASASRPPAFQALSVPAQIPTTVSPVRIRESFDPTSFARERAQGEMPNLVPDDGDPPGGRFTASEVDGQASYLDGPQPRYPPGLKAAGVEGRVTLEFVVGTDGWSRQRVSWCSTRPTRRSTRRRSTRFGGHGSGPP